MNAPGHHAGGGAHRLRRVRPAGYRTDVPVPVPASAEVLIAVSACGLNNTDVNTRTGRRVLVDPWLRDFHWVLEHARYLGSEVDGGYAEYVRVPAANAHQVRSDLTDAELASFPCSYSTWVQPAAGDATDLHRPGRCRTPSSRSPPTSTRPAS